MTSESELLSQPPPNGITKQDLDDQTAAVQRGVAESVQLVADHVDVRVEEARVAFVESVDAIRDHANQTEAQIRIDQIIEKMVADDARMKDVINDRFKGHMQWFGLVFGLLFLMSSLTFWLYINPRSGESVFVLSDIRVTGPTDLCPGESLKFEFDVMVKAVGVYSLYMSTWKVDPPPSTIIFSELQPFVIGSERDFPIVREWQIPITYQDPADSKDTPMVPGAYIRDISVVAVGKNTESTPLQVKFNVKDSCPKG